MMTVEEPPWITELRKWVDWEWQKHLKAERQRACEHKDMTEAYEVEAHTFTEQNVIYVPCKCNDCGWEDHTGD